jgi:hypothetical protein
MLNLQKFELYLIVPSFIVFLLFIVPIPLLSKIVTKIVLAVESVRVQGISILLICTIGTFVFFVNQWVGLQQRDSNRPAPTELDLQLQWQGKKWKAERDLYIHAVAFILLAAITKLARLNEQQQKMKADLAVAGNTLNAKKHN